MQAFANGLKRMSAIKTNLVGDADTRDGEMELKGHEVKEDDQPMMMKQLMWPEHIEIKTPAWRFFICGDYCLQGDGC